MTDFNFLTEFAIPIIVGICFCFGYMLKNVITTDKVNKFIPLIMGVTGIVINVWINMAFTPEILLAGMVSGLASTGVFEIGKNLIKNKDN